MTGYVVCPTKFFLVPPGCGCGVHVLTAGSSGQRSIESGRETSRAYPCPDRSPSAPTSFPGAFIARCSGWLLFLFSFPPVPRRPSRPPRRSRRWRSVSDRFAVRTKCRCERPRPDAQSGFTGDVGLKHPGDPDRATTLHFTATESTCSPFRGDPALRRGVASRSPRATPCHITPAATGTSVT